MLLEREEWGRERKGNSRGNADSEIDGMKRKLTKKSLGYPDGNRGMGQRVQRQQQGAKQHGKRRNSAESSRAGARNSRGERRLEGLQQGP